MIDEIKHTVSLSTLISNQDRIPPHNIDTVSSRQVMRREKNINYEIISWSNTKFSKACIIRIVWQTVRRITYKILGIIEFKSTVSSSKLAFHFMSSSLKGRRYINWQDQTSHKIFKIYIIQWWWNVRRVKGHNLPVCKQQTFLVLFQSSKICPRSFSAPCNRYLGILFTLALTT